ncbi:DUF5686 and carboxypeptidase regulatory-like domain-containing protein [Pontibacter sp. SGAir0037]|uniref:DUF5686 and carboxypeptidase regulatory-like domain-containing protein n=1 Tax=Pontibacter sp. SGAir0037 TaxID=2571030 RepID=UPI0010CCFEB1|nr:DUF5686 and carboxypeptidase regulatory-like domain-containing protein [Pontibacter sp. SGAir0037]QCR21534.1 membrane receptor RagA [Pontibacter sp. SGAir0037]
MKNKCIVACLLTLFLGCCHFAMYAQGIRGTVKDDKGEPLPYASIYIANLNNGASTNVNGEFEIKLAAGKHTVVVKYIGYAAVEKQVEVKTSWVDVDFVLREQGFSLKEVEVKSGNEDPAYTIMRKAIAKKKFHQLQYNSYKMRVYIKGTGELTKAPFFLKNKLKEEGVKLNEAYTTESVSEITFKQPNKVEENVISIRTKGDNKGSASPSSFIQQSFYNDKIAEIVSPLSRSAFAYYRFEYAGSFEEKDIVVNKIKVTPRSRGDQVFEGYIYIIEDYWAIHSLDLKTSIMGFPISAKQNYAEVAPRVWLPVTHQYKFSGKVMGFAGEFKYMASCSNYQVELNKDLIAETEIIDEKVEDVPKEVAALKPAAKKDAAETLATQDKLTRKQYRQMITEYEKEARKAQQEPEVISERSFAIDKLATKRDSAYWEEVRPVPLTVKELQGYNRDDSLALVEKARITGVDSANVIRKKRFKPTDLIGGASYNLSPKMRLYLDPTLAQTHYNTVEGVNVNVSGKLRYQYDSLRRTFEVAPMLRYGFSSKDFYAKSRFSHTVQDGLASRSMFLEGGKFVPQFNEDEPIHPYINTLSTLFFRRSYMKLYEKWYAKAGYAYKPTASLKLNGSLEWAQRNQLYNKADYSLLYGENRTFTPNLPENNELADTGFPQHEALIFQADVSYRPALRYRVYNGRKYPVLEQSPELLLMYRKGISGALGSDVDLDQVQLGVKHGFSFGVRGRLELEALGGTFLNNNSMYFMDYQHFDGNRTILSSLRPAGAFRLLDYYAYSTARSYFSGHTHYQFRRFLLTQLPEVRFAGLKENIFVNYLKTSTSPHYYELGYSLDNVFRVFRVEAAASFQDRSFKEFGFRVGVATFLKVSTN